MPQWEPGRESDLVKACRFGKGMCLDFRRFPYSFTSLASLSQKNLIVRLVFSFYISKSETEKVSLPLRFCGIYSLFMHR